MVGDRTQLRKLATGCVEVREDGGMQPLAGIRVIEAASYISGPFAGAILADLGAEVIKVEPRGKGDPYRRIGHIYGDSGLVFKAANPNKTSVFLDLKDETDLTSFRELLSDADVLITNWRPSVAPSLGLDADQIQRDHPQLVWVRVSGYGQDGPMSDMPAYDPIVQARTGGLLVGGGAPELPPNLLADKVSAMSAAQAASAALIQRQTTGKGAICDLAMIDAMAYFNAADVAAGHRMVDHPPDLRVAAQLSGNQPCETADGWIVLSPVSGRQLRGALGVVGRADEWDNLVAHAGQGDFMDRFGAIMTPELLLRPTAELEAAFRAADVPATAVLSIEEHLADAQIKHNGTYEQVDEPGIGGWVRPRTPALFNGEPAETAGTTSPPLAG